MIDLKSKRMIEENHVMKIWNGLKSLYSRGRLDQLENIVLSAPVNFLNLLTINFD
jgi:hypothetical protein